MSFVVAILCASAAGSPAEAVQAAIAEKLGVPAADVSVLKVGLAAVPESCVWTVELPSDQLWGTVSIELEAELSDKSIRHYRSWAKVSVWAEVPVVAEDVAPGQKIPVRLERQQLDLLYGARPVDPDKTWRANVALSEGEVLTSLRVEAWPDAQKDSPVQIRVQRGALVIQAPGKLAEDAWVGEPVEVTNLLTKVDLTGIYTADGSVLIGVVP